MKWMVSLSVHEKLKFSVQWNCLSHCFDKSPISFTFDIGN